MSTTTNMSPKQRQLEDLKEEFATIRLDVTPKIIALAVVETGDSPATIYRYLNGEVKKVTVGKRILDCLKNLISEVA